MLEVSRLLREASENSLLVDYQTILDWNLLYKYGQFRRKISKFSIIIIIGMRASISADYSDYQFNNFKYHIKLLVISIQSDCYLTKEVQDYFFFLVVRIIENYTHLRNLEAEYYHLRQKKEKKRKYIFSEEAIICVQNSVNSHYSDPKESNLDAEGKSTSIKFVEDPSKSMEEHHYFIQSSTN